MISLHWQQRIGPRKFFVLCWFFTFSTTWYWRNSSKSNSQHPIVSFLDDFQHKVPILVYNRILHLQKVIATLCRGEKDNNDQNHHYDREDGQKIIPLGQIVCSNVQVSGIFSKISEWLCRSFWELFPNHNGLKAGNRPASYGYHNHFVTAPYAGYDITMLRLLLNNGLIQKWILRRKICCADW